MPETLPPEARELAATMDHTFLRPYASSPNEIESLCAEAVKYGFASDGATRLHFQQCGYY